MKESKNMDNISRRDFLALSLAFSAMLAESPIKALAAGGNQKRSLVVLSLSGGNDGLNTVIPYGMGQYYDLRPNIGIKQDKVLPIDDVLGLHPSMTEMHQLFKKGQMAIIQGTGYIKPNRSHFRSMEIWQTAQPDIIGDTGWLGRYLDTIEKEKKERMMLAVNVDPVLPLSLLSRRVTVPSVFDLGSFRFKVDSHFEEDRQRQFATFQNIYKEYKLDRPFVDKLKASGLSASSASEKLHKLAAGAPKVKYPDGRLAAALRLIAQMQAGGVGARVYTLTMDGFDTHANQSRTQPGLLSTLSSSLGAFLQDLQERGVADDVAVLVYSEFGRRAAENGGRGTDHGTAAPCFVLGQNIKGGLYGETPSLTSLDSGDLKYTTDFRQVYTALLESWLDADARSILGGRFEPLAFV